MSDHSLEQVKAQLNGVIELAKALRNADSDREREEVMERIYEDPLEVAARTGWHDPNARHGSNESSQDAEEYKILLCTGGPAVRIVGKLNKYGEPERPRIEHQDWHEPWTSYHLNANEKDLVLEYSRQFWYGG